jgi:NADH:ubiquinone oxidoreductase subunit 3 (subunit A)
MRGIETYIILAIILTIAIILVVILIIVNPAMLFGSQSGRQITFREFCFHWSIKGYKCGTEPGNSDLLIISEKYTYSIREYCSKAGAPDPCTESVTAGNDPTCVKICKGTA